MRVQQTLTVIAFCFLFAAPLLGASFDYSESVRTAYRSVISLRIPEAEATLKRLKTRTPDNLAIYHLENYTDFLRLFVSEDPALFAQLRKNEEIRIRLIQTASPTSPYYLYTQADIRMQWALLKFRFNEPISAFVDLSRSYKLLRRNQELFPHFLPNQKNLGLLHALAGTIPDNYRWGAKMLGGISGTVNQGRTQLERVLNQAKGQDFLFEEETTLIYAYVLLNLCNEGEKAWKTLISAGLDPLNNPLHCYVIAGVAMQTGRNGEAIRLLQSRKKDATLLPFPQLDYMLGAARLFKLDPSAHAAFQTFLTQHKGENGIKDTYRKLAWLALAIHKDQAAYTSYIQQALQKGAAYSSIDKNALKEAQSGILPHTTLLKSRLLFDGGYYTESLQLLQDLPIQTLKTATQRLEYHYRMGRVQHGLKNFPKALASYQKTIELGKQSTTYFACNATLQSGLIHEQLGNFSKARYFFNLCLSLSPEDYRTSLHQSAKAGLSRLADKKN